MKDYNKDVYRQKLNLLYSEANYSLIDFFEDGLRTAVPNARYASKHGRNA
jgi:hypothetical protein